MEGIGMCGTAAARTFYKIVHFVMQFLATMINQFGKFYFWSGVCRHH